ncbi:DUF2934 domain-containing protein [Azospirillum sp. RWY-5-1]|uniref:DUF2934 domain-containing protein n=1 Tax=Azospirillum oleiclasticum TaxID=2735135 RepID=A0ABX2TK59_9PROT|nr:DUF2934 domain-containing protein [Azospirillum oleiclasticum]NYZ17321.1 DUF2934 domain-containing protein [Azospirillum oleiclasticum]NYZ24737.1 DUF2934 domain-containing protein [Azospirillum oleiclasticum]
MDDTRIRDRAYELWESEGRPDGRHEEHWHQARRELDGEGASSAADSAADSAPGPDAGIPVPGNASQDSLHEAAERFRDMDREQRKADAGTASTP